MKSVPTPKVAESGGAIATCNIDQCRITVGHSLLKATDDNSRSISFTFRFPRSKNIVINHDGMSQSIAVRHDIIDKRLLVLGVSKLAMLARPELHQELIV